MPARLRSGPVGKLHRQCHRRRHRVRPDEREAPADLHPSRLFIYYNERVIEGTVNTDAGAMLRDGIKTVAKQGACPEPMWPYLIARFKTKPSAACYAEGAKHTAVSYQRLVQSLSQMQGCLASGYPFVFGFTVYESFETNTVARTGHVPMPASGEHVLGGHAVCAVGYDIKRRWFICRNSWGTSWGMRGYFTIPLAYLTDSDLCADFWTIRVVCRPLSRRDNRTTRRQDRSPVAGSVVSGQWSGSPAHARFSDSGCSPREAEPFSG